MVASKKWLKKYTDVKHLEGILTSNSLFLGDPTSWPDKNDVFAINHHYSDGARVTCMTMSPDRYHFWTDYGGGRNGVCLWFSHKELEKDLKKDKTLGDDDYGPVYYPPLSGTSGSQTLKDMKAKSSAFVKREQYADEREFRIIRRGKSVDTALRFSKSTLKRIYLNSWLEECCVTREKEKIRNQLNEIDGYKHVKIEQNRVRDHKGWQDALCQSFGKGT